MDMIELVNSTTKGQDTRPSKLGECAKRRCSEMEEVAYARVLLTGSHDPDVVA
jgi:hypothetical protein